MEDNYRIALLIAIFTYAFVGLGLYFKKKR